MRLAPSCRRVSELLSQQQDGPLSLMDRLRLRLHLLLCGNCQNVQQQLAVVDSLAAQLFSGGPDVEEGDSFPRGAP